MTGAADEKQTLRSRLRKLRREHVEAIPDSMRGLLLRHPPAPLLQLVPSEAVIGVYHAVGSEAPAARYAAWFAERGHRIALPWFANREAVMQFRDWANPLDDGALVPDPFGAMQPADDADEVTPDVVFVPLVGFTAAGGRLGQGGGHYDRFLAANPAAIAIGLGWDCQLLDELPAESHDHPMRAVVTPTRLYGPF